MGGVLAGGPGFIAWGYIYPTGPRIWWSVDGLEWEPASVPAIADAWIEEHDLGDVNDVVAGGPGFVAIGNYLRHDGVNTAIVWTSVDGRVWQRIPYGPVFERSHVSRVVTFHGKLLAFGCEVVPIDCVRPVVWSSTDGLSWSRTTPTLPKGDGRLDLVASAADRLWGFGGAEYGLLDPMLDVPTVLRSTDGLTWSRGSLPFMTKLHALPDGLYALVQPLPTDDDVVPAWLPRTPGVFRSKDLRTWVQIGSPPDAFPEELSAVGDTLLLGGAAGKACWIPSNCTSAAWRSTDGGATWTRAPISAADGGTEENGGAIVDIAAAPDGTLVGVGRTVSADRRPSTAAWVSLPTAP